MDVVEKYILGNENLCKFVAVFLYALSCFACIFDFLKIISNEMMFQLSCNVSSIKLSDSVSFWNGAFCIFIILYSNYLRKGKQTLMASLLFVSVLVTRDLNEILAISQNHIFLILFSVFFIPFALLMIFSKVSPKSQTTGQI